MRKTIKNKKNATAKKLPLASKRKVFSRIFLSLIVIIGLLVLFFIVKTFSYGAKQKVLREELSQLQQVTEKLEKQNQVTDNLDVFCRYFVTAYYDQGKDSKDYEEQLPPYFAEGIDVPRINRKADVTKQIASVQLWKKEQTEKNRYDVAYLVSYKGGEKNGKELIHFTVEQKKERYSVMTYPFFESVGTLTAKGTEKAVNPLENQEQVGLSESRSIQKWLEDTFLPKYFSDIDINEMGYMMKDPQVLGTVRAFERIDNVKIYSKEDGYIVKAIVILSDPITKAENNQELSLILSKKEEGNYFVEKIKHDLGE